MARFPPIGLCVCACAAALGQVDRDAVLCHTCMGSWSFLLHHLKRLSAPRPSSDETKSLLKEKKQRKADEQPGPANPTDQPVVGCALHCE